MTPKVGDRVRVHGDESVGMFPWDASVEKVLDNTVLVKDDMGYLAELSEKEYTPTQQLLDAGEEMRQDYLKDKEEYEKSLNTVTGRQLSCKCDNKLDDELSIGCKCSMEGYNPRGKILEVKKLDLDTLSIEGGESMDLDYRSTRRFKGPND